MRKINRFVSLGLLALLLVHGLSGAFQLAGIMEGGKAWRTYATYGMMVLMFIHIVLGIALTFQTLKEIKKAGTSYWKGNEMFWLRRISGFAIIFAAIYHVLIFTSESGAAFRLQLFDGGALVGSLLLVLAVLIHGISNIKPLVLALGAKKSLRFVRDFVVILGIACLVMAAGFVIYYLRWNILWR